MFLTTVLQLPFLKPLCDSNLLSRSTSPLMSVLHSSFCWGNRPAWTWRHLPRCTRQAGSRGESSVLEGVRELVAVAGPAGVRRPGRALKPGHCDHKWEELYLRNYCYKTVISVSLPTTPQPNPVLDLVFSNVNPWLRFSNGKVVVCALFSRWV